MNEKHFTLYETEAELRQAVEKSSRRSLNDNEWATIAPVLNDMYDDLDVAELAQVVRDTLPQLAKPSRQEKALGYRQAHVRRAALQASEMVEDLRKQLFDGKIPPFPEDATAAAAWIEELSEPIQTMRLILNVTLPAAEAGITPLFTLKDLLNQHLPENAPIPEDPKALGKFLDRADFINDISFEQPAPLEYLGLNPKGEIAIKRIAAPEGTLLERIRDASGELAAALKWKPYAAVLHLLTGGTVAPAAIQATNEYRVGEKVFGDTHSLKLEIADPYSVTEQDLIDSVREVRSEDDSPWGRPGGQRSRVAPRSERVIAFVGTTLGISWEQRFKKWNVQYPDDPFRTIPAMKKAHSRAHNH